MEYGIMPKAKSSRKQLFKAALALDGTTAQEWAESHGITAMHVSMVLNGRRESARLLDKIDAFVAKKLGSTTALAG
jgi:gp16 family phage-associated protein